GREGAGGGGEGEGGPVHRNRRGPAVSGHDRLTRLRGVGPGSGAGGVAPEEWRRARGAGGAAGRVPAGGRYAQIAQGQPSEKVSGGAGVGTGVARGSRRGAPPGAPRTA